MHVVALTGLDASPTMKSGALWSALLAVMMDLRCGERRRERSFAPLRMTIAKGTADTRRCKFNVKD
jgi:hypothetical protein